MFLITTLLAATLSTLSSGVSAAPAAVWTPPVIEPHAGAVWVIGQYYNITWGTDDPPDQITDYYGHAILAKGGIQNWDNLLASNFVLLDGWVTVQCPDVEPADDYAIVLFGDSGDIGPQFTIASS
ncbi:hypothetical protein EW026_g2707 [Hermanssonia centrifuga]|uniref:Uncharacterized protein n=1 Tax=Hermanssonia centrifuga TaxID=98765 RepID=A0A4S4KS16_9APHY|nr:hypothetical protein EW026_g2707 [Hermanssonia centrifuga]